jgi:hypothetical protein
LSDQRTDLGLAVGAGFLEPKRKACALQRPVGEGECLESADRRGVEEDRDGELEERLLDGELGGVFLSLVSWRGEEEVWMLILVMGESCFKIM